MYYELNGEPVGVLNDFDLAAVMDVGQRTPIKKGSERTGTIPYMAVDLLDFPNGEIGRRFRHDLESCSWCLAWHMMKVKPRAWYEGSLNSILQFRLNLVRRLRPLHIRTEWQPYYNFLKHCLFKWDNYSRYLTNLVNEMQDSEAEVVRRQKEDEKMKDVEFLRPDTEVAKSIKGVKIAKVLENLCWLDLSVGDAEPSVEDKEPLEVDDEAQENTDDA